MRKDILYFYSPALKKVGLYWICLVLPSFLPSFRLSLLPSVIPSFHPVIRSIFVTLFSGTVTFTKLKIGTHIPTGLMYCVYLNQGQGPITLGVTSLDRFYFLPLMKIFCYTFLRNYESCKIETWYTHGQWTDVSCIP